MKFANYIQRETVNPVDLEILGKTYNTLEQGHQAAVQATSALQTEMAKLDLNEAEAGWRQQKINEIRAALEDNSYMGNAYHALDDITRLSGDIASDQGLLGRLQAQQDYKKYIDNLDRRTDLTEEKKEYYRDVNKYNYNETIDPNTGKVTSYSKWQPIDKEVSEVPLSAILENARKWMIEDSGYSTEFSFLDENGNVVTDPSQSHTGEIYMKKGNSWVRMPEKKVREAIEASINSIPGARESLAQDYKIAKWRYAKYGNEGGAENPLIDENGQIRTAEKFLEARINPFVTTNTYYHEKPTIEYGNALKSFRTAQIEKAAAVANGSGTITDSNREGAAPPDIPINPILMKNTSALEATQDINMNNKQIGDIVKEVLPNEQIDVAKLDIAGLKQLYTKLDDNLVNTETKAVLWDAIREREEAEEFLNAIKDGSDIKDQAAFNLYLAIDSGQNLPEDEYGFRDKYNNIFNKYWDGETKAIRNYLPKEGQLDDFITYFGGSDLLKSSGIKYGYVDGKAYVQINEENKEFFEKFARAVNFATENNRSWLGQRWQQDVGMFAPSKGDAIRRIDDNGKESALVLGAQQFNANIKFPFHDFGTHNMWNRYELTNTGSTGYDTYLEYVDKLKYRYDKVISQPNLTIETRALIGPTARANELWSSHLMFSEQGDMTEANKYLTTYKAEDEAAKTATINALDLTRHGAYVLNDETNRYEKVTSKQAKEYELIIRRIGNHNDIDMATVYLPDGHGWSPQMTVRYKDGDEEKTFRLIAPGAYSDETLRRWNRNTKFRAQGDIIKYKNANRPLKVTDAETFGDIGRMKLRFDNGRYFVETDNDEPYEISVEDAIELRDNYHIWNDTYGYVKAGLIPINSPSVQAAIVDVAKTLALYQDGDVKYAEYYVPKLVKQLTN